MFRFTYTDPMFRHFRGLEKVPEASIGEITREARKLTQYALETMRRGNLNQYKAARYLAEYGALLEVKVIGNLDPPLVIGEVVLDRDVITPEEYQACRLFYFFDSVKEERFCLGVRDEQWAFVSLPPECELPEEPVDLSFWTGDKKKDVLISAGKQFYGQNGVLLLDAEDAYDGLGVTPITNGCCISDGDCITFGSTGSDKALIGIRSNDEYTVLHTFDSDKLGQTTFNLDGTAGVGVAGGTTYDIDVSGLSANVSVVGESRSASSFNEFAPVPPPPDECPLPQWVFSNPITVASNGSCPAVTIYQRSDLFSSNCDQAYLEYTTPTRITKQYSAYNTETINPLAACYRQNDRLTYTRFIYLDVSPIQRTYKSGGQGPGGHLQYSIANYGPEMLGVEPFCLAPVTYTEERNFGSYEEQTCSYSLSDVASYNIFGISLQSSSNDHSSGTYRGDTASWLYINGDLVEETAPTEASTTTRTSQVDESTVPFDWIGPIGLFIWQSQDASGGSETVSGTDVPNCRKMFSSSYPAPTLWLGAELSQIYALPGDSAQFVAWAYNSDESAIFVVDAYTDGEDAPQRYFFGWYKEQLTDLTEMVTAETSLSNDEDLTLTSFAPLSGRNCS